MSWMTWSGLGRLAERMSWLLIFYIPVFRLLDSPQLKIRDFGRVRGAVLSEERSYQIGNEHRGKRRDEVIGQKINF
jgi:hypothetical protein